MPKTSLYLILGYGVPKNIFQDQHYATYLNTGFNRIYDDAVRKNVKPVIMFSGGKTDCFKPYHRSEAGEMAKLFRSLMRRASVKAATRSWKVLTEMRSLSTIENLLNAKSLAAQKHIPPQRLHLFCEKIREGNTKKLARKVFIRPWKVEFCPVDFDVSLNRYSDPKFLKKKERRSLKLELWAFQSPKHLQQHHQLMQEKVDFLRKTKPEERAAALKTWWEKKFIEFDRSA